jgi:mRNA interferase MazF
MKRGDIVTISTPGDYGKPRPAIIIQSDRLDATKSVMVCPMTSTDMDSPLARLMISPERATGLRIASFAMVEKCTPVRREKCGPVIGRVPNGLLLVLDEMLAVVMGLAD